VSSRSLQQRATAPTCWSKTATGGAATRAVRAHSRIRRRLLFAAGHGVDGRHGGVWSRWASAGTRDEMVSHRAEAWSSRCTQPTTLVGAVEQQSRPDALARGRWPMAGHEVIQKRARAIGRAVRGRGAKLKPVYAGRAGKGERGGGQRGAVHGEALAMARRGAALVARAPVVVQGMAEPAEHARGAVAVLRVAAGLRRCLHRCSLPPMRGAVQPRAAARRRRQREQAGDARGEAAATAAATPAGALGGQTANRRGCCSPPRARARARAKSRRARPSVWPPRYDSGARARPGWTAGVDIEARPQPAPSPPYSHHDGPLHTAARASRPRLSVCSPSTLRLKSLAPSAATLRSRPFA
jgi:hypothetical protein